nr:serine/arginine repetitive matrix protein 1-like [Penaeus vannamei]
MVMPVTRPDRCTAASTCHKPNKGEDSCVTSASPAKDQTLENERKTPLEMERRMPSFVSKRLREKRRSEIDPETPRFRNVETPRSPDFETPRPETRRHDPQTPDFETYQTPGGGSEHFETQIRETSRPSRSRLEDAQRRRDRRPRRRDPSPPNPRRRDPKSDLPLVDPRRPPTEDSQESLTHRPSRSQRPRPYRPLWTPDPRPRVYAQTGRSAPPGRGHGRG